MILYYSGKLCFCKKAKARIVKLDVFDEISGYFTDYTTYDARDDMGLDANIYRDPFLHNSKYDSLDLYDKVYRHAESHLGYVETNWDGSPVSKVFKTWYTYRLYLEFTDYLDNQVSVQVDEKTESEQNRCAMACQGCGAVFYFYLKRQ